MLNKQGQRELAYVVEIDKVLPIEGADRVELAVVGGWHIMVKKGQFKAGDLAVYFEIDSRVPAEEPFLFLEQKNFRIRTQKYFKGKVVSQGLLMAAEDFEWEVERDLNGVPKTIGGYAKGDFLTGILGVTYADPEDNVRKADSVDKYARMAERHPKLFGNPIIQWIYCHKLGKKLLYIFFGDPTVEKVEWPDWVVKTDEERVQNMTYILQDKSEWVATEKIDGTSVTATLRILSPMKSVFYVCSRNVVFDRTAQKTVKNVYTEIAKKYQFNDVLGRIADHNKLEWVTLQGEIYGENVQKRDYGLEGQEFVGFNLIFSDRGRINSVDAAAYMSGFDIPWVPIVDEHFVFPDTVDELLSMATGKSAIDGGMREGLVFRSQDGSKSFKAVSNEYLLKYHG